MRMKLNQKIAGGASVAVDCFWQIITDSEFLEGDAYNAATSATILENSVEQTFRGCEAGRFLKDERFDGYYLISADEHRNLTFQVDDTARRCRELEKLANNLSSKLFELRDQMKQSGYFDDTQPSAQ